MKEIKLANQFFFSNIFNNYLVQAKKMGSDSSKGKKKFEIINEDDL
jgi:hypothetical protein